MSATVRPILVECPECHEHIEVPLSVTTERNAIIGTQFLTIEPDMADLWAHAWTHGIGGAE